MTTAFAPRFRRAMRTLLPAVGLTIGATLVACRTADAPELDPATTALMLPGAPIAPPDDRPMHVPSDAAEMGEIPPSEAIAPWGGDTASAAVTPDTAGRLRARLEDTLRKATTTPTIDSPLARPLRR